MEQKVMNLAERIAALEAKAEQGADDREEMKETLHEIRDKINRWEGKFGGVLFILGCLFAFFSGAFKAAVEWLKLKGDL